MRKKKKHKQEETRFIRNMSENDEEWTEEDLRTLIASMKRSVPEVMKMKTYVRGRTAVDWEKVAFPPFSPEACQQKWEEVFQKMFKLRSLTDLIVEAEEAIKAKLLKPTCEPKKLSLSGYHIFLKEQMNLQQKKFTNSVERCTEINKMWKELSKKDQTYYNEKYENGKMKYSIELWKWFKALTPAQQEDYLTSNPNKRRYLEIKRNTFYEKKEPDLHRPSDSEDDDIEYSSSDEEPINWDCEEEEVEEEEGDDMFEMYW